MLVTKLPSTLLLQKEGEGGSYLFGGFHPASLLLLDLQVHLLGKIPKAPIGQMVFDPALQF